MSVDAKFIRDIDQYFKYPTDENPTTQQAYQEAVRNWVTTEEAIVDSHLWQPTTNYSEGNQVKTPSLPPQCVLVCITAGTSGNEEPDYTNVDVGDSVTDGTVTWLVSEALTSAGGTMLGEMLRDGILAKNTGNSGIVRICGGDAIDNGAVLTLWGKSHSANQGEFRLQANNGNGGIQLIGYPSGTLRWNGSNVLTDNTVGSMVNNSASSNINLAVTTAKTLTSVSLPAGTWVVMGHVRYENITAGRLYAVGISNTANDFGYGTEGSVSVHSTTTGIIAINTCRIITISSTTTHYLCGYVSAACTATAAQIRAVRIV